MSFVLKWVFIISKIKDEKYLSYTSIILFRFSYHTLIYPNALPMRLVVKNWPFSVFH